MSWTHYTIITDVRLQSVNNNGPIAIGLFPNSGFTNTFMLSARGLHPPATLECAVPRHPHPHVTRANEALRIQPVVVICLSVVVGRAETRGLGCRTVVVDAHSPGG